MADCVSGLFISLSLTKHDGSLQFVLTLVYSCETVWPPVRVIPLDAMRVIALSETGENDGPDTYETVLHTMHAI